MRKLLVRLNAAVRDALEAAKPPPRQPEPSISAAESGGGRRRSRAAKATAAGLTLTAEHDAAPSPAIDDLTSNTVDQRCTTRAAVKLAQTAYTCLRALALPRVRDTESA